MSAERDLSEAERYPTLSSHGRQMLEFLREHPSAPIFRNESGNRLCTADIEWLKAFEAEVETAHVGWRAGQEPGWVESFVAESCLGHVPFYRGYGAQPVRFEDLPTISRADLSCDIAAFVPDGLPITGLINFRTSGTTGHPLLLASHPVVAASYAAFHKRALSRHGVVLRQGRGKVGVVLVGYQRQCFTYVSVNPLMGESGLAKINLHPSDWRDPNDPARYLAALDPELYTGDPISLSVLAELPFPPRPAALLSTSMELSTALRERLSAHFGCPVIDVYSMNEAGPIAALLPDGSGHELLQHRMFVEILDEDGRRVPEGQRGEVTLTGGFNPYLPLLRYRTGDYAALRYRGTASPVLEGLQGRPPVRFRSMSGELLNNLEITHALKGMAIPQFTLHQDEQGDLEMRLMGHGIELADIEQRLLCLFGAAQRLTLFVVPRFEGKIVQYTCALAGTAP